MQNVPNILSLSRILATVVIFVLVLINTPLAFLIATVLFVLGSGTDFLDGYLARRYKLVSPLGVFLDLTADKVFVSVILIALVQVGLVPAWIVAVIIAREFLVTGLRSMASAKGKVIPAGKWGKQKTLITMVAMSALLLAKGLGAHQLSLFPPMLNFNSATVNFPDILLLLADVGLVLAALWTVLSGAEYMISALPIFQKEREANPLQA
ncbi:MAG: CDP-diacylglycerol--glycerol-3-phosphate 3-phosphatidyltransferase [Chloroflexi bacterium]|nr:MAG: CDP-diacylglycerol--glycerol-3-phosphate 3-phosphatidyltransferase [Chloroflexota bacterium]TMC38314.1 MAG: CDP-diacylglycerol--glycerol-3-phosphate 3-phosphatidyltransferase [Chloroflexota bacterium]TMD01509.1 MAG: CDP-diacylglycerol--glycerol-3-phosphate 3-phosphatidyltransferase [Chloroflexota bacterium]TMD81512.1 MAG: CDP-diacylglycerol--glycerol-3-phosphate 3-phosphatidyltransferase [Chloroflexota bacterium]TME65939.1 MAG: CDP-diacylglycerol--glycerol-3-phosphate 3-phosphatidyltran